MSPRRRRKPLVLVVLGTRPEVIKLAPVIRALKAGGKARCRVAATGQHRELLDQMLRCFGLRVDRDLRLMRPQQSLNAFAARALAALGELVARERPRLVVVQGDTTTALCGALAAFHAGVPVAHVEAGLRTGDLRDPFPEEANRVLIDELASLWFAPTRAAARALRGRDPRRVVVTGNTVVDAVRWAAAHPRPVREPKLARVLGALRADEALILATLHRRERFQGDLARACEGIRRTLAANPGARVVFPVHLNPRVQAAVRKALRHERAHLLPALDYFDLVAALRRCRLVMTDSGGLQEEAPSFGKPVLVLRRATERPEAVAAGAAAVVGLDPARIAREASRLLKDAAWYARMAAAVGVFGDGKAGERVAAGILRELGLSRARPKDFASA